MKFGLEPLITDIDLRNTILSVKATVMNILHCGGEEETYFIAHLKKAAAKCNVLLEYRTYQSHQSKETILYHDAQKYSDQELPCLVLVSKAFFDLIWKTNLKHPLVDIITNSMNKCLHIWLDVKQSDVER